MSYTQLSALPGGSSGNAADKQGPKPLDKSVSAFSHARVHAQEVIVERPSYVTINQSGSFYFLYTTTSSINGTAPGSGGGLAQVYTKGAVVQQETATPVRLDINPVAWSGSAQDDSIGGAASKTGDVTFVYQGGL